MLQVDYRLQLLLYLQNSNYKSEYNSATVRYIYYIQYEYITYDVYIHIIHTVLIHTSSYLIALTSIIIS